MDLLVCDALHYDPESLAGIAVAEETAILGELGLDVYVSGTQDTTVDEPDDSHGPNRYQPNNLLPIHESVYVLHLAAPSIFSISIPDRRIAQRLMTANPQLLFLVWKKKYGLRFAVLKAEPGHDMWTDYLPWLAGHPSALAYQLSRNWQRNSFQLTC